MSDPVTSTPAKKTRQMAFTILEDGAVRAEFGEGIEPRIFNPGKFPESIFLPAYTKGVISRLQAYTSALSGDDRTPATLATAIDRGLADLSKGIWAAERIVGVGAAEVSIEAEAAHLFRVKRGQKLHAEGKGELYTGTLEESAAAFALLSEDQKDGAGKVLVQGQKSKLKATDLYKSCYAEIKARRAAENAAKLAKKANQSGDIDF